MKFYYPIITFLIFLINIPYAFAEDTLKIETILEHDFDTYYNFPKQTDLNLSGHFDICPSNDCKMIFDKSVDDYGFGGVSLSLKDNMTINGFFKLTGSGKDNDIIGLTFPCEPVDTKTTTAGTTKYMCSGSNGSINPVDEKICCLYYYDFTASFELPSRHFVLKATHTGTT